MTIRESVFAALRSGSPPLAVYNQTLPQNPNLPALAYTMIFSKVESTLNSSDAGLTHAHVQIDAYATSEKVAEQLANVAAELMFNAEDFNAVDSGGGAADGYESETRLYRVNREFSIWMNT